MCLFEWPNQSPDLGSIEVLWHDLKKMIHTKPPNNTAELKQFCEEEWWIFFSLTVVQVWFAITENILLRKEGQNQLLNPRSSQTFPLHTVKVYMVTSIKNTSLSASVDD